MKDAHTWDIKIGATTLPELISGTITMDEAWSPYIQARVIVPLTALTAALDPDTAPRVVVTPTRQFNDSQKLSALSARYAGQKLSKISTDYAGQKLSKISTDYGTPWNDGTMLPEVSRRFDLRLRKVRTDAAAQTVELTLESDESYLQDYKLMSRAPISVQFPYITDFVNFVLARAVPNFVLAPGIESPTGTYYPDSGDQLTDIVTWNPGTSAQDVLSTLLNITQVRVYCDENRVWHISDLPSAFDFPAAPYTTISHIDQMSNIESTVDATAEDHFNAALVVYNWTDAANLAHTAYDFYGPGGDGSTPGDINVPGQNVKVFQRRFAIPVAPFEAFLEVNRAATRTKALVLSVMSDYTITPNRTNVKIISPYLTDKVAFASSVAWEYPSGEMTITPRGVTDPIV